MLKDRINRLKNRLLLSGLITLSTLPSFSQNFSRTETNDVQSTLKVQEAETDKYITDISAMKGLDINTTRVVEDLSNDTSRKITLVADNGVMVIKNSKESGVSCVYGIEKNGKVEYHIADGGEFDPVHKESRDEIITVPKAINYLKGIYKKYGNPTSSYAKAVQNSALPHISRLLPQIYTVEGKKGYYCGSTYLSDIYNAANQTRLEIIRMIVKKEIAYQNLISQGRPLTEQEKNSIEIYQKTLSEYGLSRDENGQLKQNDPDLHSSVVRKKVNAPVSQNITAKAGNSAVRSNRGILR